MTHQNARNLHRSWSDLTIDFVDPATPTFARLHNESWEQSE